MVLWALVFFDWETDSGPAARLPGLSRFDDVAGFK